MAHIIDLGTYGSQLKKLYDTIVSSDPDVSWAVFNYASGENQSLKPSAHGNGSLDEFVDEFDDGKVQYGFARVDYDNRPKYVLVGWVGEGVPERTKGYFNAHYATVSKYFPGYHVQITARSSDDLSSSIILQKIADASGSKYNGISKSSTVSRGPKYQVASQGASEDDWSGTPEIKPSDTLNKVQSSYKPTKVDIAAIRASASNKAPAPAPVHQIPRPTVDNTSSSSYKPVGKVDIAALRAQGKGSKFADDGPPPLQSSYKPVGKVDIAAIRAQASAKSSREPSASVSTDTDVDESPKPVKDRMKAFSSGSTIDTEEEEYKPKSVKDRMSVFSSSGRLTEMPKRTVSNSVASRFTPTASTGRGTAPAVPAYDNLGLGKGQFEKTEFQDHASEGGKTPAQIWAEKHGKVPKQTGPPPEVVNSSQNEPEEEEHESVADVRQKFANASVEDESNDSQNDSTSSFADVTSRFAAKSSSNDVPGTISLPVAVRKAPEIEHDSEIPDSDRPVRHFNPGLGPALPGRPIEGDILPPADNSIPPQPAEEHVPVLPGRPAGEQVPVLPGRPEEDEASGLSGEPAEHVPAFPATSTEYDASAFPTGPIGETTSFINEDQAGGITAVAEYPYQKDEENEIGLEEGEIVTNINKVEDDWWIGTNSRGETGLFPANYVTIRGIQEDQVAQPAQADQPAQPITSEGPKAIAEYDYTAEEEGELTFVENDIIKDIHFDDTDWWSGTINGIDRGLFPATYVKLKE